MNERTNTITLLILAVIAVMAYLIAYCDHSTRMSPLPTPVVVVVPTEPETIMPNPVKPVEPSIFDKMQSCIFSELDSPCYYNDRDLCKIFIRNNKVYAIKPYGELKVR